MSESSSRPLRAPTLGSEESSRLRERAHALIPGGSHTYAKGDDQFPVLAPATIERGEGCRVWDSDGNEFIEYGMGLRAVTLGHAHPEVVRAVADQLRKGTNYTRPATIEGDCAEALLDLIPAADMVKFCKDGSAANSAAVRLARAHTGRDLIAICGDQPFFSSEDWFIGTTPMNAGIPPAIRDLTVAFEYNELESLESLFRDHPGRIACVMLEAERTERPRDGFLTGVQALCAREGAVFVLDEMITGFRWDLGGAQRLYDLTPDLTTFGKAMANGFSLSALAGKREIMELGGLRHDRERVFLLSTTHGAETHSLAAGMATMRVYREENVVEALHAAGKRLREGVTEAAVELGIHEFFHTAGRDSNLIYVTRDPEGRPSQEFRTLFLQETIGRGLIAPSFVVSSAHSNDDIDHTVEAVHEALVVYRDALANGIDGYLEGRPVKPVHRAWN